MLHFVINLIVYTPLIILCLSVVSAIGYGVWYYKNPPPAPAPQTFPPSYIYVGSVIKDILIKILTPLKSLAELLWWIFPFVFPSLRGGRTHAWDNANYIKSTLLAFLTFIIILTTIIFKYGYPDTINSYSNILNGSLIIIAVILLSMLFVIFSKTIRSTGLSGDPWVNAVGPGAKRAWLFNNTKAYLYYLIGTGLGLGLLFLLFYFVIQFGAFNVAGTTFLAICAGIGVIWLIYNLLTSNTTVINTLNDNEILSNLFYLVFIIPCLFGDTVKYLFNQLRHTPKTVYMFLIAEILFIGLFVIVPIIQNYFYTLMPHKKGRETILKKKIQTINRDKIVINAKIKRIKKFNAGVNKNIDTSNLRIIDDEGWKTIISKSYNNPDKKEELTKFLINYGYISIYMCENPLRGHRSDCSENITKAIMYIQTYTKELVALQNKLDVLEKDKTFLVAERDSVTSLNKGSVLLREPVYLNNSKNIGNFDTQKLANFDIGYNYNYAISCWVFLRANALNVEKGKYKSILNYGGKPNIMYNPYDNKLKIVMAHASENVQVDKVTNDSPKGEKEFIIENVSLQKWTNIVVNYDSGVLDIFVDAKLLASFNNIIPYMSRDQLIIGDDKGISGGICNVVYFPLSISKERIDINYNILSNKNPPIV
jgi:hypothetical protein